MFILFIYNKMVLFLDVGLKFFNCGELLITESANVFHYDIYIF